MIRNYFIVAWRNLKRNKVHSFINILGLSIGLTCCILISLYLDHETSYDSHHSNADNLYQLATVFIKNGEKQDKSPNTAAALAPAMKREFPEVEEAARLSRLFADDKTLFQYNAGNGLVKPFYETKGYMADPEFFRMFDYQFVEGEKSSALKNPNTIVVSEEIARKIFGNEQALNKTIHVSSSTVGEIDCAVTGVFRDSDNPSHIDARFFINIRSGSYVEFLRAGETNFANNNMYYTYFLLKPGTNYKTVENKFPAFMKKYASESLRVAGFDKKQFLIPVKKIHTYNEVPYNVTQTASTKYLYILGSIALFTLLIACINFMNLSTARSSKRSAEVGVRKVLGAEKSSLVRQFIGESLLMSFIAFAIACFLAVSLLSLFNEVSGRNITINLKENYLLYIGFFGLAVVTGFIAGSYPAFYLSSFKPVKVLKGKISNTLAAVALRKGLVVFQFVISVALIISFMVINRQMSYMQSKDLGFSKDQQLIIPLRSSAAKSSFVSLKNALKENTDVRSVGGSLYYPGIFNPADNMFYRKGQTMADAKRSRMNWVDYDYLQTLEIKPVAGRLFNAEFPADTAFRIVINETAVREFGFASAEKAVGEKIYFDWQGNNYTFDIIGVVKDFHYESLHLPITPYAFQVTTPPGFNYIVAQMKTKNIKSALQSIEASWKQLNPNEPFEYSFLDADFQKNYEADNRLTAIVGYFTIIAILISCLGLFGLATFSAEQRIKEIGVRKVLGAGVVRIVAMLSADFLKLVLIAAVIASPIAWYAMKEWLNDFAYATDVNWMVFAMTILVTVAIALLATGYQAVRAALANPVESLRAE